MCSAVLSNQKQTKKNNRCAITSKIRREIRNIVLGGMGAYKRFMYIQVMIF